MLSVFARSRGSKTPTPTLTETLTSTQTLPFTDTSTTSLSPTSTETLTTTDTLCGYGSCAHYKLCYSTDNTDCFFGLPNSRCPTVGEFNFYFTVGEYSTPPDVANWGPYCFFLVDSQVPVTLCGGSNTVFDATYCGGSNLSFFNESEYSLSFLTDIDIFEDSYDSCDSCCDCYTPTPSDIFAPPTITDQDIQYPPTPTLSPLQPCDYCDDYDPDKLCPPRPTVTPIVSEYFISALSSAPLFIFYENNCYYQTNEAYDLNRVYNPIGHDNCDTCYTLSYYRL